MKSLMKRFNYYTICAQHLKFRELSETKLQLTKNLSAQSKIKQIVVKSISDQK